MSLPNNTAMAIRRSRNGSELGQPRQRGHGVLRPWLGLSGWVCGSLARSASGHGRR